MSVPVKSASGGALKWAVIFVLALFALLFILQKIGLKSVYTKEVATSVDFNSPEYQNRERMESSEPEDNTAVDNTLQDIAKQFAGEVFKDPAEREKAQENIQRLSADEKKFYTTVKKQYSMSDQLRDAENWLNILRASRNTYREVQSAFGETDKAANTGDLTGLLTDPVASELAYDKLRNMFGIAEEESRQFAAQGNKSVSDWAAWIAKKKE